MGICGHAFIVLTLSYGTSGILYLKLLVEKSRKYN